MSVLEVTPQAGAISPLEPDDVRQPLHASSQLFSSPAARPVTGDTTHRANADSHIKLGMSERGLRTATDMLQSHLAVSGGGNAAQITAALTGMHSFKMTGPGLVVLGKAPHAPVGVALVSDPLVLLAVGALADDADRAVHWTLLPGGPSVTARADALSLLRALTGGGSLMFKLDSDLELPPMEIPGDDWDQENEWRLFEDLACLEEWSGITLPMPNTVSAAEATRAGQAASWTRTRQVTASISGPITFIAAATPAEVPDELQVHQAFGVRTLDVEVPLGEGVTRVRLARVEQTGKAPSGDGTEYRAWPSEQDVTLWLRPPASRRLPPRRTQPDQVSTPSIESAEKALSTVGLARPARRRLQTVLASRNNQARRRAPSNTSALLNELRET
jgi:hypothetical protein